MNEGKSDLIVREFVAHKVAHPIRCPTFEPLRSPTMRRNFVLLLASMLFIAASPTAPASVEVIASYPHGTFLENVSVAPKGLLYFTSYIDRKILVWSGNDAPTALEPLTFHPVGILAERDRIIVSAHAKSFLEGPAFTTSNLIAELDASGKEMWRVPVPDAKFLNGLARLSPTIILVADSLAGRIWQFDTVTRAITPWLIDPRLAPDPAKQDKRPGANGLKVRGSWLFISNSSRGKIYKIRLAGGKPRGILETAYTTGPVDDFTFDSDGTVYATTHGDKLLAISPTGKISEQMSKDCGSCTSVAIYGRVRPKSLIVLTTGNFLEGGNAPAQVLRLPFRR